MAGVAWATSSPCQSWVANHHLSERVICQNASLELSLAVTYLLLPRRRLQTFYSSLKNHVEHFRAQHAPGGDDELATAQKDSPAKENS